MRILDVNNNEITSPDLSLGFLQNEQVFVKHHDEIIGVEEKGHWETIKEYPNGGKDVEWVVDVPAVESMAAWDEYEDILRYIQFSPEELDAIKAQNDNGAILQRLSDLEEALDLLLNEVTE